MKIERKAKIKERIYMNKEEGRRDHRGEGLPAEGYEARQGHIIPSHHVRWWLTMASLRRRVSLERKIVLLNMKRKKGKS
jgi:hypothetical protein